MGTVKNKLASVDDGGNLWKMQIRLWKKNESGLREMVSQSGGLITASKLANFAVAVFLTSKKLPISKLKSRKR